MLFNHTRLLFLAIFALQFFYVGHSMAANSDYLFHILSTGQSLSLGANGTPPLTTSQPYNNKMLDASNTNLIPLIEPSTTTQNIGGETINSAMANALSRINGSDFQTVVTSHGWGGYGYNQLKKGTTPYNTGLTQLSAVHARAGEMGKIHKVIGVTNIHGEADQIGILLNWTTYQSMGYTIPYKVYKDFLVQWQKDYEADVKAVTGQTGIVPMFTDQMSSNTGNACGAARAGEGVTCGLPNPISALGQFEAMKENPGKIFLVGPKYFLTYADGIYHLNNYSYRLWGEYYGKVINQVFNQGIQWKPLMPIGITMNNNIVYVKFNIPKPATQLVFDTTAVDAMPNKGFEYFDTSGTTYITNVELDGADAVKITLNAKPPVGYSQNLAYAYTGTPGAAPGPHSVGSVKGNLRDNDPTLSVYETGKHLYNWGVHFYEPITLDAIAPLKPSSLSVK